MKRSVILYFTRSLGSRNVIDVMNERARFASCVLVKRTLFKTLYIGETERRLDDRKNTLRTFWRHHERNDKDATKPSVVQLSKLRQLFKMRSQSNEVRLFSKNLPQILKMNDVGCSTV